MRSLEHGETHYTSNSGTLELRQAVAEHLRQRCTALTTTPSEC